MNIIQQKSFTIKKLMVMIISLLMLSFLLVVAASYNPIIYLNNPVLESVIRDKIDRPYGRIYQTDLMSILHLNTSDSNLESLEGIQYLRKLTKLILDNNQILDFKPLQELEMLTYLSNENNKSLNLETSGFFYLKDLPLRSLFLNNCDTAPQNPIEDKFTDISVLRHFSRLEELGLRGLHIKDLSSLANLVNLKALNLRENKFESISPLSGLINLTYLNLHSNSSIESLEAISNLIRLEKLILRNVSVGDDIVYLQNLTKLNYLNIRNCDIRETEVLGNLMANGTLLDRRDDGVLAYLDIRDNILTLVDYDPYADIRQYWNQISHSMPGVLPYFKSSVQPPEFSATGGYYTNSLYLVISHTSPDVIIYYTLDGSIPDTTNVNGRTYQYQNCYEWQKWQPAGALLTKSYVTKVYVEPISISDRSSETDKLTHIATTFHNSKSSSPVYFPSSPVHKGTVLRAMAVKPGRIPSQVVTHTYFVGKNPNSLPIISIAVNEDDLFDYERGIYVAGIDYSIWRKQNPDAIDRRWHGNYHRRGNQWEVAANIEFIPDKSDSPSLNQEMGLRIHGGLSRRFPSKSLRIYACENTYRKPNFDFPFFSSDTTKGFKRLMLRNSGSDFFNTYILDAAIHLITQGLNFETQLYQPATLYLNGEYWGIINIRERYDKYYFARVFNVDPENIDYLTGDAVVKEGGNIHYKAMLSYIRNNDVSEEDIYKNVCSLLDESNFMDYMITNIFIANTDWPGQNIDYWRYRTDEFVKNAPQGQDGRWRWLLFDTDSGFEPGSDSYMHNTLSFATEEGGKFWPNPDWSTFILREMLKNRTFRDQFVSRFCDLLNTAFLPDRMINIIRNVKHEIAPEMPAHINRWKSPYSMDVWEKIIQDMYEFALNRPDYQRQHIRDYFNLGEEYNINLIVNTLEQGYIRVNTIDIKTETMGVYIKDDVWSGTYFSGMDIEIKALSKPGYRFVRWEGIDVHTSSAVVNLTKDIYLTAVFEKE